MSRNTTTNNFYALVFKKSYVKQNVEFQIKVTIILSFIIDRVSTLNEIFVSSQGFDLLFSALSFQTAELFFSISSRSGLVVTNSLRCVHLEISSF